MLLYSTILNINSAMDKEAFINLVIEWNNNNPHEVNRISGITWNGEQNIRFGDEKLWLEVQEYPIKNIVAIRYEKVTDDGVIWDTDYIMNFNDMKLSIQLDRSYREDALVTNAIFSTPLFISHLIEHGYLEDDGDLVISNRPLYISGDNLAVLASALSGRNKHQLPIVFVSKTQANEDPVDVSLLASKLKGAAHVLVQEDRQTNKDIRIICDEENDYNGTIGIYYPNEVLGHKRCAYRDINGIEKILLDRVLHYIFEFGNLQNIDTLYTWQGVSNALLNERLSVQLEKLQKAERDKEEAQNENAELYSAFDEEFQELQQKVEELTRRNDALVCENAGLVAKLHHSSAQPVIFQGEEEEFYPGEIKDFVLSVLADAVVNIEKDSRKQHVVIDIVESNGYKHLAEDKKQRLKSLLKGYKTVSSSMKQELMDIGFEISDDGKHYKLIYNGDPRYTIALAKTPSDNRSGDNIIGTISRKVF